MTSRSKMLAGGALGLGWLVLGLALPAIGFHPPDWAVYLSLVLAVGLIAWGLLSTNAEGTAQPKGGDAGAALVVGDDSHAKSGGGGDAGRFGSGGEGGDAAVYGSRSSATGGKGGKGAQ
jgi:hypothetical protein